jgi:hypothetical protein
MTAALILATLTALAAGTPQRERNPFAPSLPLLSKEEQERFEKIIDRFIDYENEKLSPKEGAKAVADFNALGKDATFQLIAGLNKAANMESSCPAVVIGRKLARILGASDDLDLLEFAHENIGAGVKARRHMNVIRDLRVGCTLRRGVIQRQKLLAGTPSDKKAPRQMKVAELAEAAATERGPRLQEVLTELEQRKGERVLGSLAAAAESSDEDVQKLARGLLVRHLTRQKTEVVREALKAFQPSVRAAAAEVAAKRRLPVEAELIDLLKDKEGGIDQFARKALVRLSKGPDFGPEPDASAEQRADAQRQWKDWWQKQRAKEKVGR